MKVDIFDLLISDILLNKVVPIPVKNRGHLGLTKVDLKKVKTLMVVLYSNHLFLLSIFACKGWGERGVQFLSKLQVPPPPPKHF